MDYKEYKAEVEFKYGKAEYDFNHQAVNQSAKLLDAFRIEKARQSKKLKPVLDSPELKAVLSDTKDKYNSINVPEIKLLDSDLKPFNSIQRDILREYFKNRDIKPSTLASQFNQTYQFVAGFLKSRPVKLLELKYFYEDGDTLAQLSVLKGLKAGDSRLTLAYAEARNILATKQAEDNEFKSNGLDVDEHTKACLTLLADWLTSSMDADLVIPKPSVPNPNPNQ